MRSNPQGRTQFPPSCRRTCVSLARSCSPGLFWHQWVGKAVEDGSSETWPCSLQCSRLKLEVSPGPWSGSRRSPGPAGSSSSLSIHPSSLHFPRAMCHPHHRTSSGHWGHCHQVQSPDLVQSGLGPRCSMHWDMCSSDVDNRKKKNQQFVNCNQICLLLLPAANHHCCPLSWSGCTCPPWCYQARCSRCGCHSGRWHLGRGASYRQPSPQSCNCLNDNLKRKKHHFNNAKFILPYSDT